MPVRSVQPVLASRAPSRLSVGPKEALAASAPAWAARMAARAESSAGCRSSAEAMALSIPIYSGGALSASLRKANIQQIQSEVDALSARDEIKESVISAWSTLQNSTSQIDSAQAAVSSSQLVVDGTIQERDVGQKTTLDVLNAQAELTSAREQLITARSTKMIAAFSLLAASGKLSPEVLGLRVAMHSADGYIANVEDVWAELRALSDD